MNKKALLMLGCAALIVGCGKESAPVAAPTPAPAPAAAQPIADLNAVTEVPAPPMEVPGVGPTPAPEVQAPAELDPSQEVVMEDVSGDLHKLSVIVQSFRGEQGRMPSSIDELVSKGFMPRLPKAPAGKKLAIDPKSEKVVLINL